MEAGNEFDVLLRRALLDGVRADHEDILTADMAALPEPVYSMGYLQWQQKLRKAPFRRAVPQGRRILRAAACLLLVLGLSGILAWTNPTTSTNFGARTGTRRCWEPLCLAICPRGLWKRSGMWLLFPPISFIRMKKSKLSIILTYFYLKVERFYLITNIPPAQISLSMI